MIDHSKAFSIPRLTIDRFAITIGFLPLIDREQAFRWLQKINHDSVKLYPYYRDGADVDWCCMVLEFLQRYFLDRPDLMGSNGKFYASTSYQLIIALPIGVHLSMGKNKVNKVKCKHELYGPYQLGKKVLYVNEYESFDSKTQIRLQWNPNKTDICVLGEFLTLLSSCLGFNANLDVKITEMDWAVDFPTHYSLSLVTCDKTVNLNTITDRNGGITKYLGAKESDVRVKIYDKKKELWKKSKIEHPNEHFFRFEVTNKKNFYLGETSKVLEDIFKNVLLLSTEKLNNCQDLEVYTFHKMSILADCHFEAIMNDMVSGCLGHLSKDALKSKKKRLRKKFRSLECEEMLHPSEIFEKHKNSVWNEFKDNLMSNFLAS